MTGPVVSKIVDLFKKHDLDPDQYHHLVVDLMHLTYDGIDEGVDVVLGRRVLESKHGI